MEFLIDQPIEYVVKIAITDIDGYQTKWVLGEKEKYYNDPAKAGKISLSLK